MEAIDRMKIQLEYEQIRLMNVELVFEYGPQVWTQHVSTCLAPALAQYQEQLLVVIEQQKRLNIRRKQEQVLNAKQLERLKQEAAQLRVNNQQIQVRAVSSYTTTTIPGKRSMYLVDGW